MAALESALACVLQWRREELRTIQETLPVHNDVPLPRLSDQEAQDALAAIEEARALRAAILKRRKGKRLPPSARLIRQAREERWREL